ncbi:MAG: NACHT domain-containing protein, partial [Gammaproteobacteria bacterium]
MEEDRKEFEIFINRKNKDWFNQGIFLELIVWEDFLDAVSKTRLQDEYNKAIRECDIFVMLFCTKMGQYTEEEFETAFGQFKATNKPFIFTYFKDAQFSTGSANKKDLMSLWAFQEKLGALGHFYTAYKSLDELKLHFNRQLDKLAKNGFIELKCDIGEAAGPKGTTYQATLTGPGAIAEGPGARAVGARGVYVGGKSTGNINTGTQTIATQGGAAVQGAVQAGGHFIGRDFVQFVTKVIQGNEDPEEAKSIIALYLHALVTDLAGLKLGEIDTSADQTRQTPLQLADIYVPLDTTLHIPKDATLADWLSRGPDRQRDDMHAQRETRPVSALEALATHRELTVLGKPGSGKSTFGASVLLTLAQAWQGQGDEPAKLGETWAHGALLPIRVVLRHFAEQLSPGDKAARAGDVWAFIARDLDAGGYGLSTDAMKYVQRIARTHGALILLDGLDECGQSASRERVRGAVNELMRSAGPQCRFVLTARPYAWPGGPDPARGVYVLADLNDAQIEQFIR